MYLYEKADYDLMRQKLNINWKEYLGEGDVEDKWRKFLTKLEEIIKECVPVKVFKDKTKMRRRTNKDLPINRKLWTKIRRKKRLWARLKRMDLNRNTNDKEYQEVKMEYRQTNNQVRNETRKIMKNKEHNIAINVKENPKLFWKYVQEKLSRKAGITELYKDDSNTIKTKSDEEKAERLANYFSRVFTNEPEGNMPSLPVREVQVMPVIEFTIEKIKKAIRKLKKNKSPGPDKIHPRFIKEGIDQLAEPLKLIFEHSFNFGEIPMDWSLAFITATFKKGNKSDPVNYRPVSLTSIICKLMETMVREDVMKHMKSYKLFSQKQFGFLSGRSTVLQLIKVIDNWMCTLDEGGAVDVIYCDFMKAFDKMPHGRLLEKIRSYNVGEKCLMWMEAFLRNQKQCVIVMSTSRSGRKLEVVFHRVQCWGHCFLCFT